MWFLNLAPGIDVSKLFREALAAQIAYCNIDRNQLEDTDQPQTSYNE